MTRDRLDVAVLDADAAFDRTCARWRELLPGVVSAIERAATADHPGDAEQLAKEAATRAAEVEAARWELLVAGARFCDELQRVAAEIRARIGALTLRTGLDPRDWRH